MPTNEKEYNGYLFDQLSILEEIEEVATQTNAVEVLKTVEKLKKRVNRKLYQEPPLTSDVN
jgi:polyhydroxyalkanoate synthesis regulator phasin